MKVLKLEYSNSRENDHVNRREHPYITINFLSFTFDARDEISLNVLSLVIFKCKTDSFSKSVLPHFQTKQRRERRNEGTLSVLGFLEQ